MGHNGQQTDLRKIRRFPAHIWSCEKMEVLRWSDEEIIWDESGIGDFFDDWMSLLNV